MMLSAGMVAALAALTVGWQVEVVGCPDLEQPLGEALALELRSDPRLEDEPTTLAVSMTECEAKRWRLSLRGEGGRVLAGPTVLKLDRYSRASRIRAAVLWGLSTGRVEPSVEEATPVPEPTEDEGGPLLGVGLGSAYHSDPAELSEIAPFARVSLASEPLPLLELGLASEGGALFEPFGHGQPWLRLCGEGGLLLAVTDGLRFGLAPRACLSTSRHLRNSSDEWTAGVALGGLLRGELRLSDELWGGLRVDVEAWERDLFVPLPRLRPSALRQSEELPWLTSFALSVEIRWAL